MHGGSPLSTGLPGTFDDARAPIGSLRALQLQLTELFDTTDVPHALARLNARTRFRFTGLYRVEPALLRNLYLYDRENPELLAGGDISLLNETYCAIVVGNERYFETSDAGRDARLRAHPARMTVLSYLGVPVRGCNGCVSGTLCHFDVRPRIVPAGEVAVLELAAALLPSAVLTALSERPA